MTDLTAIPTPDLTTEPPAHAPVDARTEEPSSSTAAAADPHPWITQLTRAKAAMSERLATGEPLGFRVDEFWAEASWPLHTIASDDSLAAPSGDFVARLAKQGLTPAMNVILHHKSHHHVGAVFGPHAYEMSRDYGTVEALAERRKQGLADLAKAAANPDSAEIAPKPEAKAGEDDEDDDEAFEKLSKAQKKLKIASYGARIDLKDDKVEGPQAKDKFAYLQQVEKRAYPAPEAKVEPEAWAQVGAEARALCDKFGLRAVNVPLAFDAAQAGSFVARLDSALTSLSEFVGAEASALGLCQWLGLRARAPGERDKAEAAATEDVGALAEKEKEAAKKKKSDSEHGMFMGGFIQIEVSPNFEPVVLAHEWIHSLDLWFGSRDIVAKQPWQGWKFFASQLAFTSYDQSPLLRQWREQLVEGGAAKSDYLGAIPEHAFLSQMRFDAEENPPGEFYLAMGSFLASRLMRSFHGIPMDDERKATTAEQSVKLGEMIAEAARVHAMDHRDSAQGDDSLARRRKEFYVEWGDLAAMWARRQAGSADEKSVADMEALMRAHVLGTLAGAWNWAHIERNFPKPDVHTLQALRMDSIGGSMSPYFSTPHEMLAYKMEELFLAHGSQPAEEDKVAKILLAWLREEAVPALREARDVSFQSLMGVKTRSPSP